MIKKIVVMLLLLLLTFPGQVLAADFYFDVHMSRTEDGTTYTEVWYNNRVLWKIALLSSEARPVAGMGENDAITVVPDLENGMFVLKIFK